MTLIVAGLGLAEAFLTGVCVIYFTTGWAKLWLIFPVGWAGAALWSVGGLSDELDSPRRRRAQAVSIIVGILPLLIVMLEFDWERGIAEMLGLPVSGRRSAIWSKAVAAAVVARALIGCTILYALGLFRSWSGAALWLVVIIAASAASRGWEAARERKRVKSDR